MFACFCFTIHFVNSVTKWILLFKSLGNALLLFFFSRKEKPHCTHLKHNNIQCESFHFNEHMEISSPVLV